MSVILLGCIVFRALLLLSYHCCYCIVVTVAGGLMCVLQYSQGDSVASFLPFSLDQGYAKSAVGILLTAHILVSYCLTNQPLASKLQCSLFGVDSGHIGWIATCLGLLALAYVVANVVPFFSDFQGIIGSALGAPIV